ncbi:MAG: flagellar protein FlaG [Mariprofundaceae bacterium]|nr:flagellar protein FlaG [Mariprofundaceae bacterium]
MIEVSSVSRPVSSPVSSKPEAPVAKVGMSASQNVTQKATQNAPVQQEKVSEKSVQQAVAQANIEIAGGNEKIGFGYEKRLGQLYVQVLDKDTGEVIKEIPPKEFIEHQVFMKELAGILLDRNA